MIVIIGGYVIATDPATLEVIKSALISIPEEMGTVLKRTAYSVNIKERMDASCAVFDSGGGLIAQAEHIPVHLGSMPIAVEFILDNYESRLYDGDQLLMNDPYLGGTHIPDLTVVKPVFLRKKLVGFTANRAHHADMGGSVPGSMPGVSSDIFQEGLRLPPCKVLERGLENLEILRVLEANTRTPEERLGDLRAQCAANMVGAKRLLEFIEKYSYSGYERFVTDLQSYSRRRMLHAIQQINKGTYRAIEYLDDDGVSDEPVKLSVVVKVSSSYLTFDFGGSAPESPGNLNAPAAVTTACVFYAVRCITDPTIPPNRGCFEPIRINIPSGTILNPREGAAVSAGNVETSQRVADLIFSALAPALPEKLGGQSQGTMNNTVIGGPNPSGGEFSYYETIGGGEGALPYRAGQSGIQVHMTNTANTPIEALESIFPLRVESYEFISGSGGSGVHRGGDGLRRALRVLVDGTVLSIQSERRKFTPKGSFGGEDGRVGKNYLIRNGKKIPLPGKTITNLLKNDVVVIESPGGGGYGKRKKRSSKQ
ncbi:MAG: hydantoinase B/oxoprolinase family protein [Thermoplasmata archaeon]|nr:MAG: hydantoinase B/oxoprolinase family protein [Thermoplasmata archaeon]